MSLKCPFSYLELLLSKQVTVWWLIERLDQLKHVLLVQFDSLKRSQQEREEEHFQLIV